MPACVGMFRSQGSRCLLFVGKLDQQASLKASKADKTAVFRSVMDLEVSKWQKGHDGSYHPSVARF